MTENAAEKSSLEEKYFDEQVRKLEIGIALIARSVPLGIVELGS